MAETSGNARVAWAMPFDLSVRRDLRWRSWQFAVLASVITVVICAFCSFVVPSIFGAHDWVAPGDAWWTVRSAGWVANGAVGSVYQSDPFFLPLPGVLFLIAPVVMLGNHLGLVSGQPIPLAHPSMWLLIGPVFFLLGSTCILGVDYLADSLGVTVARRRSIAMAIGLTVVVPTCVVAGHPEDLLALGLSCLCLGLLLRGSCLAAALTLSVAVMMQPWAGLLIPILVTAVPAAQRIRSLFWSAALPGACTLLLLMLDPSDAFRSLVEQPMMGSGQRLPWWGLSHHITLHVGFILVPARIGSTSRTMAVVVAVAAAVWVLRDRRPMTLIAASSIALLARGVFETQFWCWYIAPAAVLMTIGVAAGSPAVRWRWLGGSAGAFVLYGFAAGSYDFHSIPAWLALAILVGTGTLAVAASLPQIALTVGKKRTAASHFSNFDLGASIGPLESSVAPAVALAEARQR